MKVRSLFTTLSLLFSITAMSQQDSLSVATVKDSLILQEKDSLISTLDEPVISDTVRKKNNIWSHFKYDVVAMAGGFGNAFVRPVHWGKTDYMRLGATVAGVGLLYLADEDISNFFVDNQDDAPMFLRRFGRYFGSPQINYGITGGVYVAGLLFNNEKLRRTGVLMITAASATGAIQQLAKSATGRARPIAGLGKHYFKPFGGDAAYRSFPSGHTVLAVTTTYALSKQFRNPWVKAGILTVGAIVPVSRIVDGAHWLTDVALSSVMSIAVVEGIDKFLKRKEKYTEDKKYAEEQKLKNKITWDINAGPLGIGIVGRF